MFSYILRKVLTAVPVLLLVSLIVFLGIRLVPGDPASVLLGTTATPERVAALQARLGLDRPLHEQYITWLENALRGDLGESIVSRKPVAQLLRSAIPVTLQIILVAELFAILVAIALGVMAAARAGSALDHGIMLSLLLGLSIPSFWSGIMLIILFSVELKWLPPSGFVPITESVSGYVGSLIMPCFSFGFWLSGPLARFLRAEMLEVLRRDFVRTAMAKGVPARRVMYRHALRNALIPVVTMIGLQLGGMLAGAVIVEEVFSLPGVGRLIMWAISNRDFPVVQGVALYVAAGYILINLVVDVAYALLNPRISY